MPEQRMHSLFLRHDEESRQKLVQHAIVRQSHEGRSPLSEEAKEREKAAALMFFSPSTVLVFGVDLLDRPKYRFFELFDEWVRRVVTNFLELLVEIKERFYRPSIGHSSERPGHLRLDGNINARRVQHLQQRRDNRRVIVGIP